MKLKVCGMRNSDNIRAVLASQPSYMGFIFYEKSPRYVGETLDADLLKTFPSATKKVGVFVNAHFDFILRNVKKYQLDLVQLHGTETPENCRSLRSRGISIIKAFAINEQFNFNRLNNYKYACDYFLFDTKGDLAGGTGKVFDWTLLTKYDNEKPFFMSGGIGPEHADALSELKKYNIQAIDINSRFETEPGVKDAGKIKQFTDTLRQSMQLSVS